MLLDKFKLFKVNKEQKKQAKLYNEEIAIKLSEAVINSVAEPSAAPTMPTQTKTFVRLDTLENWTVWATPKINDISVELDNFKNTTANNFSDVNKRIDSIVADTGDSKTVWDSTDNTFKDVKQIIIDNAIKANTVLYKGAYWSVEDVMNNYKPEPLPPPTHCKSADYAKTAGNADYASEAGTANMVKLNDGSVVSMSDLISDYINAEQWKQILNASTTFEQFKTQLLNVLKGK